MTGTGDDRDPRGTALRQLLHEETSEITPDPAAWDRIQWKATAARRQQRRRRIGSGALSVAAAVALVLGLVAVVGDDDDTSAIVAGPDPSTSPTTAPQGGDEPTADAELGAGIWPFTTGAEADAADGDRFLEPDSTAEAFLTDYVGMSDVTVEAIHENDTRSWEVVASTDGGRFTTYVQVRRLGTEGRWTVTGAATDDIRVSAPTALAEIASPVTVRGESRSFEGNVVVQVRRDGQVGPDQHLAQEPVTGGAGPDHAPFEGEIAYPEPEEETGGAVLFLTHSAEDGAIEQVTAVRVGLVRAGQDPPAAPGRTVPAGHLVVSSATDGIVEIDAEGNRIATVVTPHWVDATTVTSLTLTPDRTGVYYALALEGDPCTSTIWFTPVGGAAPVEVVEGHAPAVSPDGARLAFATDADCDGQHELAVMDRSGGTVQRWPDLDPGQGDEGLPVLLRHLTFSADASRVVYEVQLEDGTDVQAHDLGDPATVSGDARSLDAADGLDLWHPALRPDGLISALALDGERGEYSLVAIDVDTGLVDAGTSWPLPGHVAFYAWNAEGGLAFHLEGDPGLWRLVDGSLAPIGHDVTSATDADW